MVCCLFCSLWWWYCSLPLCCSLFLFYLFSFFFSLPLPSFFSLYTLIISLVYIPVVVNSVVSFFIHAAHIIRIADWPISVPSVCILFYVFPPPPSLLIFSCYQFTYPLGIWLREVFDVYSVYNQPGIGNIWICKQMWVSFIHYLSVSCIFTLSILTISFLPSHLPLSLSSPPSSPHPGCIWLALIPRATCSAVHRVQFPSCLLRPRHWQEPRSREAGVNRW